LRVKLAKTAGYCWGVERALDIALDTANEASGPVFTHGPLIHNPQTIELLKEKNIWTSDPKGSTENGGLLVIRAHGISPQVRERLRSSGAAIRDATCPLVAKVHGIIRKHSRQGATTIIIGEEGHPEVEGHMGYAEAGSHLVTSLEDVERLPDIPGEVVVVAQTTINMGEWGHVVDALQAKYPQARMFNTICDATEVRQEEVRKLAPEVAEAVARHHQRRDGRGFPPRKSGDRASPVAELVGAADELVRLVVAAATSGGSFDPLARMSAGILHGFSPWLAKAFREVFGE